MGESSKFVVFYLDKHQFALPLGNVQQVVHQVNVIPLPTAPKHIAGTINYHGEILPVVNLRKLFHLPDRDIELTDQLIITNSPKIKLVLWVDSADEVVSIADDQLIKNDQVYLEAEFVDGLFKTNKGVVLISDLDKFLTEEQVLKLIDAIKKNSKSV